MDGIVSRAGLDGSAASRGRGVALFKKGEMGRLMFTA